VTRPRAIGYCRVSTEEQALRGLSLDAQERKIRGHAQAHDLELVEVVREQVSGGKPFAGRCGGQRILNQLAKNRGTWLIVVDFDRLCRDTRDALAQWDTCDTLGAVLCSIQQGVRSTDPVSKCFYSMLMCFAELERAKASERTRRALADRWEQGKCAEVHLPFGYDLEDVVEGVGWLTPNARELATLGRMLELAEQGNGWTAIARALNEEDRPTKAGSTWFPASLKRTLQRVQQGEDKLRCDAAQALLIERGETA